MNLRALDERARVAFARVQDRVYYPDNLTVRFMRICSHKGLVISVLTRNEHCPPHVHVGTPQWDARYRFSFWHNGVELWDVVPGRRGPSMALAEELRQVIQQPAHLWRARERWWLSRHTVCLDNQQWDGEAEEVVSPQRYRPAAIDIVSARFDPWQDRTILQLAGQSSPLEIER
ncbi:DUF4160 domain-containing protein [Herbaspirillum sp. NPDC087042]|uniref:DUF4160 domain-containing protein n=1 Tax=Herbaspirillum sp. NPDC087042 TaxID=3364004 RepID=UPI0038190EAD